VIERYTHGPEPVYARAVERGRMLPPGRAYLESWVASRERLAPHSFVRRDADPHAYTHTRMDVTTSSGRPVLYGTRRA
jgi:hypothetical protein